MLCCASCLSCTCVVFRGNPLLWAGQPRCNPVWLTGLKATTNLLANCGLVSPDVTLWGWLGSKQPPTYWLGLVNPDVMLWGWLGSKQRPTYWQTVGVIDSLTMWPVMCDTCFEGGNFCMCSPSDLLLFLSGVALFMFIFKIKKISIWGISSTWLMLKI